MPKTCKNCASFDNSKHANDKRTAHAGICSKWCEIVFLNETCKQFFSKENPTEKQAFKITQENNQISLFN